MTLLLVFLAIAVLGLATAFGIGRLRPPSAGTAVLTAVQGLAEPDPRLPPVLLPEHPAAADVARVRFPVALRGYRMGQVDEVLDRLAAALGERDARIRDLEAAAGDSLSGGSGK
ncbi:DivIVA domain-containing protein [Arthrobacter yangruifuii]|uniref:DivIVA domain-containing protein n=1 Tax=Arthrobacter yangruifuii TaxID=2606616 RepID=A0A5N6MWB9_9MICC|nr:DivIVA domain-containing protein [Arthrobacter yangruifuii]KAD4060438.1 DivIVA domain-containing protein [Arthrobacter yangruifuii]